MYIFDKQHKLDCSITNPRFVFVVASFIESINICLRLIDQGEVGLAAWAFSEAYEKFFPKDPPNLNQLEGANIFIGEYNSQFGKMYFDLLELWIDIQDERVADLTGDNIKINPRGLKNILLRAKASLGLILKVLED